MDEKLESFLRKQKRNDLQSFAKRCGIRANRKSTEIISELLEHCHKAPHSMTIFTDLKSQLTPVQEEPENRFSYVVFENQTFIQQNETCIVSKGAKKSEDGRDVSEAVVCAFEEGRRRGIWFGRMTQKLEDLELQWKMYLATSVRGRRLKNSQKPISVASGNVAVRKACKRRRSSPKRSRPSKRSRQKPQSGNSSIETH